MAQPFGERSSLKTSLEGSLQRKEVLHMDNENQENSEDQGSGFGTVREREDENGGEDQNQGSQDEQIENESDDSQENESESADDQQGEEGDKGEKKDESQESQQKTEKGTKLDPNPKSAVHQQLANQTRIRTQMEQVLADPAKIARFVKEQYGIDMPTTRGGAPAAGQTATEVQNQNGQQAAVTTKKWTAKDFENIEDVANVVNQLQTDFEQRLTSEIKARDEKIDKLTNQVGGLLTGGQLNQIADDMASDVKSLRALPELNPESPDFVEGLEEKIGGMFHRLDFDEKTGMYRGQYSMREIGEQIVSAARTARKAGVQRGQTIVKDKTKGQIRTTPAGNGQADRDSLPADQSIAQGIAKMFKR